MDKFTILIMLMEYKQIKKKNTITIMDLFTLENTMIEKNKDLAKCTITINYYILELTKTI